MPPSTATAPAAPRPRLGRRLLGSGVADVLTTPHGVDRYLELVQHDWTINDARARVASVTRQTPDSVTLVLEPNAAWEGFSAGQFVQVSLTIDGVRRSRSYSPACVEHAGGRPIELTVKTHDRGLVSRHLAANAKPADVLGLARADGDFVLPAERPANLLLISGGSGITPVLSMLRTLCAERHAGEVTFVHYSPTPELTLYRDELACIAAAHPNVRVVHAHTRADGAGDLDGHFSRGHLDAVATDLAAADTFVCGPPALIDAARATIGEHVRTESFLPPSFDTPEDERGGSVRFARSGSEATDDGRSLLEQAEAAGLTPEHGCRMGICHSCTCRKTAGRVRDVRSGELSSPDPGEIQICVSVPVGDVELDL